MSKSFLKVRNGISFPGLSAAPSDPANGDIYYNTTTSRFMQYVGGSWVTIGEGDGSVTSVALTVPSILSVSGSPITTSGTLAITLANESANTIFAGPTTGAATTPTFRALVTADMPAGTGTVTSVAVTVPAFLAVSGSPITTSGTIAITLQTETANTIFAGPTTGGAATPAFRVLVAADIPTISLTTGVSGILPIANGGTNASTKAGAFDSLSPMTTAGDLIYGGTAGTGTRLGIGSTGQILTVVGGLPAWATSSGSGTVTSVALTVPSFLSVSGSPITTSGTLAVTLATETANTVFAGPASGGAASPTFRSLVRADMPATIAALYKTPTGTLTNSVNLVTYTSQITDTNSAYSSGLFTVPTGGSGYYDVAGSFIVNGTLIAGNETQIKIFINGTNTYQNSVFVGSTTGFQAIAINVTGIFLNDADTVGLYSYTEITGPTFGSGTSSWISVTRRT